MSTCDHTDCRIREQVTGISGCLLSWGENYRRGGSRLPSNPTPPCLGRDDSSSIPQGSSPAPSSARDLGYDPLQGRSQEQQDRNEALASRVFVICVGFALFVWAWTALLGGN